MAIGQIPMSNVGGNNQTTFQGIKGSLGSSPGGAAPNIPGSPLGTGTAGGVSNPYMPAVHSMADPSTSVAPSTLSTGSGGSSGAGGFITNASSYASGENDLQKQLTDIYGKGVGGSIFSLLSNMSGSNSTILQNYIKSLQPQFAQQEAGIRRNLGAMGVSGNSSVAAIGESNLAAQENALIAGESARLTDEQQQMTLSALMGMKGDASKEVASSGWDVFSQVIDAGSKVFGQLGDAGLIPG